MLADLGFCFLMFALVTSVYGTIASTASGILRHRRLFRSSKLAACMSFILCLAASVVLFVALFKRDYSIEYVVKNSSNDLPPFYTFTAFWSSMEGSHLLWTLLISFFGSVALLTNQRENDHIMPYVSTGLQAVSSWMFFLLVTYSDPFASLSPAPPDGRGMNALLQNPYMAFHPPTLFIGYTALAIPAAYAFAALAYGDITEGWLASVRRWTLFAWIALTIGIALGARWAYLELGWAGYWAWDPVENSSFIPWLIATAQLHFLIVQDRWGQLKTTGLVLAFLSFFFSFFGTFITRSGIISSVHAFADSPIGPSYLIFLAAMLAVVIALYAFRANSIIPSLDEKAAGFSKEIFLMIGQCLVLSFAGVVLIGTLYPILSDALTGQKTTVQAPYFNAFAPWVGFALVVLIGFMLFKRFTKPARLFVASNGGATILLASVFLLPQLELLRGRPVAVHVVMIGGTILICAAVVLLVCECATRWYRQKATFFRRNLGYMGAVIAHLGFLCVMAGFLGNLVTDERVVTLRPGEKQEVFGYDVTYRRMDISRHDNTLKFDGVLELMKNGGQPQTIHPARSKYPTKDEMLHEVGLGGGFWQDIYVTMADFESHQGPVSFKINRNPLVSLVWFGGILLVLGGALAMGDRARASSKIARYAPADRSIRP